MCLLTRVGGVRGERSCLPQCRGPAFCFFCDCRPPTWFYTGQTTPSKAGTGPRRVRVHAAAMFLFGVICLSDAASSSIGQRAALLTRWSSPVHRLFAVDRTSRAAAVVAGAVRPSEQTQQAASNQARECNPSAVYAAAIVVAPAASASVRQSTEK